MPIPVVARLLGLWVRIPPRAWMFVSCELLCCQVEVSATSLSLVERSPTECSAQWCDLETSIMRRPWSALGRSATGWWWWWLRGETSRSVYSNSYDHEHQHDGRAKCAKNTRYRVPQLGCWTAGLSPRKPGFCSLPRQSMWVDNTGSGSKLLRTSVSRHHYHFNNAPYIHTYIHTYIHYIRTYIHSFIMRIKP